MAFTSARVSASSLGQQVDLHVRGEEGLCLPLAEHADFPVVHSHPVGAVLVPGRLGRASLTCAGLWGIITHTAFGGAPLGGDSLPSF